MRQVRCGVVGVRAIVLAAAAGQLACVGLAAADPPHRTPERQTMKPGIAATRVGPPGATVTDNLMSQVNVNAQGLNIVGDAANEPTIVVDPTAPNRMAIGWRQFDTVTSNFRQAGHAYSVDGGRHWTNPGVLTPGTFRSDPVMDTDVNGRFYLVDLTSDLHSWVFNSSNAGATWNGPAASFGADKEWLVVDRTASSGRGFVYQSWQVNGPFGATPFTRSTDGGLTWMTPVVVAGPPIFGTMAVAPNGDLFIAGINPSTNAFTIDKSTNARNAAATPTFSTQTVNMGGVFGLPSGVGDPNPAGLEGQVQVDVDNSGGPRNGWVYMLASLYTGGSDPQDIMFARSTDGGQTWSAPVRVNNDAQAANHYQWFGTISVAPTGRIDVIWNDTRDSLNFALSKLYYAWSDDGGTTWQGNTPLTGQFNSTVGWPQQNKIGDYYHMRSDKVGASVAFAATFNNEQDVYFLRINDYDCNNNGIPDSTDLATGVLHDCNGNGIPDECEVAAGQTVICPCYANCDGSTAAPVLNVNDFSCFLNRFAAGDPYANCDGSSTPPILNVNDFSCFLNRYAVGCP